MANLVESGSFRIDSQSKVQGDAVDLLKRVKAITLGKFTLSNGGESDYYFDSKQLTLDPEGAEFVASQLLRKIEEENIEVVGGTAYSAIPIVSHLCLYSKIYGKKPVSAFYHRKELKGHGPDNQVVDGKLPAKGTRVAIVEDVVTSGGSLIQAIERAENDGCRVTNAIVLVDRDEGGREKVEQRGYKFWALFTVCRNMNGELWFRFNGV